MAKVNQYALDQADVVEGFAKEHHRQYDKVSQPNSATADAHLRAAKALYDVAEQLRKDA
jgi:hypothetical protein